MTSFQTFRSLYKSDFQACIEDIDWAHVCSLMDAGDEIEAGFFITEHMHDRRNKLDIWLMNRATLPLEQKIRDFLVHSEAKLGPLSDRKKAELLYDNFSAVESVEEGLEVLKLLEKEAA